MNLNIERHFRNLAQQPRWSTIGSLAISCMYGAMLGALIAVPILWLLPAENKGMFYIWSSLIALGLRVVVQWLKTLLFEPWVWGKARNIVEEDTGTPVRSDAPIRRERGGASIISLAAATAMVTSLATSALPWGNLCIVAATAMTGLAVTLAEGLSDPDAIVRLVYDRLNVAVAPPNGGSRNDQDNP